MKGISINESKNSALDDISKTITNMVLDGAPREEIAKAVKHSMDVMDAKKQTQNAERYLIRESVLNDLIIDIRFMDGTSVRYIDYTSVECINGTLFVLTSAKGFSKTIHCVSATNIKDLKVSD